jgi:RNA polymerase primary sigma factor
MLNNDSPSADNELLRNSLRSEIERSLSTLSEREADILRYFFGLNEYPPLTLEEIGEKLDLTRERVRQIKEKAIKKLKNKYRNQLLKSYLGQ